LHPTFHAEFTALDAPFDRDDPIIANLMANAGDAASSVTKQHITTIQYSSIQAASTTLPPV
jgi:hypothetical protein